MIATRIRHTRSWARVEVARARRVRDRLRFEMTHIDRRGLLALSAAAVFAFLCAFAIGRATRGASAPAGAEVSLDIPAVSVSAAIPTHPDAVPSIAALVEPRPKSRRHRTSTLSAASRSQFTPSGVAQPTGSSTAPAPVRSSPTPVSPSPSRSAGGSTPKRSPARSHPSTGRGGGSFDSSG